mgnify:FL=1
MLNESAPVFNVDLNRGFRIWHISEIYQIGQEDTDGVNNHVPNVDDMVVDWTRGILRVTYINLQTGESRLEIWRVPTETGIADRDIILGLAPGSITEHYRVYVDSSVVPHVMSFDSRLHIYGSNVSHVKVFKGHDIDDKTGVVISARYDQNGVLISDNIEVVDVVPAEDNNPAIKQPRTAHSSIEVTDGEVLTLVAYNQNSSVAAVSRLLAKNTSFIKASAAATEYIVDVYIESPFLSKTLQNTLHYPHNLPLNSMNLVGVVKYNNGRKVRYPINNQSRMRLFGIENYIPSVVGQSVPLVLSYRLDSDETTFSHSFKNGAISIPYKAITTDEDLRYNVKLYVVPKWISDSVGYTLEYYLYSMERDIAINVTQYVETDATQTTSFNPTLYGALQKLVVVIQLKDVDSTYQSYRHVQRFNITLLGRPHTTDAPYLIDYNADGDLVYGVGLFAHTCRDGDDPSKWNIDISQGEIDTHKWLQKMYANIDPLVIREEEAEAPIPNHMLVTIDNDEFLIPIEDYRELIQVDFEPNVNCMLTIQWIRQTPTNDLHLGISSLNIVNDEDNDVG